MRKYMLLGASMLLLAVTACTREKEVVTGTEKLSFKAVVDDGATRTAYTNDKTASWVAGDQISVYVTDRSTGQVVTFTADESLTFHGEAPAGYRTIVAGVYPADAGHTFDAYGVKTLHFPASYTLAEGADPASILPLVGTFDADGVMTFHHPAGALKFTIDNVPAAAVRFRFTTSGHKINGSFAMDPVLDYTVVDAEKSVDISFPAAEGSRAFYVPMPAGELAAGASIALYDGEDNLLFQKAIPAALTVRKNVIKRIAAVSSWTKNEDWQAAYKKEYYNKNASKVYSQVEITGTTGLYDMSLASKSYFESHYGSVEGFLASGYIAGKQASGTTPKTGDKIYNYNKLAPGVYEMVIYGLDENYNFTGEYNLVEIEVPEFVTPEGWSATFNPAYKLSNGEVHPAFHVQVPEGTTYTTMILHKDTFESSYGSDVAAAIWSQMTATSTIRTSTDINLYFGSLDEDDYVYIVYGIIPPAETGGERKPTFEYCLTECTYTKPSDEPTEAYQAWLGTWSVTESSGDAPFTDTWTIAAKQNNATYTITGLIRRTSWEVAAQLADDGTLLIKAQKNLATYTTSSGYEASVNLYGKREDGKTYTGTYDLMRATLDASDPDAATLAPPSSSSLYISYLFYGTYTDDTGANKSVTWTNGVRSNSATMTRVIEDSVLAPDGLVDEDFLTTVLPDETSDATEAE